ncbi:MAG TPA: flagellar hook basal-body protein [Bryobacteraceae bacterium]|nr:flagellar hook basal-body protein [Bryobacteraceae bacterium]
MDPITISAASGLRSRMESLELLANNLANAETSGYKTDHPFYGLYTSAEAFNPLGADTTLPVVERQWTDFSQGTLTSTGSPLDIGLSGPGFLVVNGPSGPLYTRNGSLKIAPSGELVTGDGYSLRAAGSNGQALRVAGSKPIEISPDGQVRQDGQDLGKLDLVEFPSTNSLKKLTGAAFQNTDASVVPVPAANVLVQQGKLETSNVTVPDAAMRLVGVMRQFEMLQKAVSLDSQMNQSALQEVARVTT